MYLENIVFDSVDPHTHGRFWQELLGCEFLDEDAEGFETRLAVSGGPTLDLCFQRVPEAPGEPLRLHMDLFGGTGEHERVVSRAVALGAHDMDRGQTRTPATLLADPAGTVFGVLEDHMQDSATGPIAALLLESAAIARDAEFWSWLSSWGKGPATRPGSLRHRSGLGPILELCPESAAKGQQKNRVHLDMRLESFDDAQEIAHQIVRRGGCELEPNWGELTWRVYQDPSGNEFCVLPAAGGESDD